MQRWKQFFKMTDGNDELKRRYALGKVCTWVLVQFLHDRGIYPPEAFGRRSYEGLHFVVLERAHDSGGRLDKVMKQVCKFIESSVLRSVRLQIAPLDQLDQVVEELQFQFTYGPFRASLDFGGGPRCSWTSRTRPSSPSWKRSSRWWQKMQRFCEVLDPLPEHFDKRFRASFRSSIPFEVGTGPFQTQAINYGYADGITSLMVGKVGLEDVGAAAVLHTLFLAPEALEQDSTPSVQQVVIDGDEDEEAGDGDGAGDPRPESPPPPPPENRGEPREPPADDADGDRGRRRGRSAGRGRRRRPGGRRPASGRNRARCGALEPDHLPTSEQTTLVGRDSTMEESDDAFTLTTEDPLKGRRATKRFNVTTEDDASTIKVTRRSSYRIAARNGDTSV
ncbi:hypothetical protein M3Y99_00736100 [Aphelenchoides fujianensis]|nr:hypothetical protein M3Y99_00736100 [Aphelenchoides fujianensis]